MNKPHWLITTLILLLIQVIWMNNVGYAVSYVPHVFILALLIYPPEKDSAGYFLFAFLTGFVLDFVSGTGGLYALASLSMAALRQFMFAGRQAAAERSIKPFRWTPWQWIWRLALWALAFEFFLYFYDFLSLKESLRHIEDILGQAAFTWIFTTLYALLFLHRSRMNESA